ncbi:MAG: hypothetical protein JWQ95_3583 [Sphaerisporangium sp.]|nr:hypothetical protein [Sphaerisporangium sp.]
MRSHRHRRPPVRRACPFDSWRATWSHFRRQTAHLEWVDGDELEEIRRHQQALVGALIGNYATLLRQVDEQGPAQGGPAQGGAEDSGAITALEGLDEHTDR